MLARGTPSRNRSPCPRRHTTRGATLVELIFATLIASILLSVGVMRLGRSTLLISQAERVARGLVADLRYAQSCAVAHATAHALVFTEADGKLVAYTIVRAGSGGDVVVERPRTLPDNIAIKGSATRATFNPTGDAGAAYAWVVTTPGRSYGISVALATGAVILQEL